MAEATIPFDVLNRWSGEVQFTAQIACSEDALPAVKLGLAVRWAHANGASLVGASLVGARLDGARLDGARLDGASLVGARLDGARLDGARLDGASLDGARLDGARLDGASLVGASLDGASLVGARLDGASLVGARLDGASLVGASLVGARLDGALLPDETLRSFKADMWLTLSQSNPLHVQHLIFLLKSGKVDGSTYGDGKGCACLVGSLAHADGKPGTALDHNSGRPAERWFMMIKPGDTPGAKTGGGFAAGKALEWAEGWCAAHGVPTEPEVQDVAKPKRAKRAVA